MFDDRGIRALLLQYIANVSSLTNSPGRFFAVNEMKLLMAELLIKYDVRLIPGTKPKKIQFGLVSLPEVKLRVLIRARKGVGN